MPKETVHAEPFAASIEQQNDEGYQPRIELRWSRECGDVQLVTKATDFVTASSDVVTDIAVTDGYYVSLSRYAINDLIRKLRRARDQAFGRDE